eukprot:1324327-Alexandrium_andersonii.AAC.1
MCGLGCALLAARWAVRWAGMEVGPACCSSVCAVADASRWIVRAAVRAARVGGIAAACSLPRGPLTSRPWNRWGAGETDGLASSRGVSAARAPSPRLRA